MDKDKIIELALISGFALSTAYGQEAPKLMPISDDDTIVAFAHALLAEIEREIGAYFKEQSAAIIGTNEDSKLPSRLRQEMQNAYQLVKNIESDIKNLLRPSEPKGEGCCKECVSTCPAEDECKDSTCNCHA